jgi:hypothetical protein
MSDVHVNESVGEESKPLADCDMVMKGGITSGVVYPRAAVHLSRHYRFRRVGGASAGAIAAAFVAAAEHGRDTNGFGVLETLPSELASNLSTLFQPSKSTAAAYQVLTAVVDKERGMARRILHAIGIVVRRGWLVVTLAVIVLAACTALVDSAIHGWPDRAGRWVDIAITIALWSPAIALVALLAGAASLIRRTLRALPANGYGLCDGHTRSLADHSPLTDWMATNLDRLAGVEPSEPPLTFGRLWGKEAVEDYASTVGDGSEIDLTQAKRRTMRVRRQIDIEVMTTNLTLRRPYRFPFETRIFWFCPDCWSRYFPDRIVAHMVKTSTEVPDHETEDPSSPGGKRPIVTVCPQHGTRVRTLPRSPDMPLVVAARISLSFPGLISAVPLHVIDWGRIAEHRALITVWFSDGGIASNFPTHLFDAFWPRRPTFAINLQPLTVEHGPELVVKPRGILPRSHSIGGMIGFAHAIADTMQNWVDNTQLTMPGYRDRVVEIRNRAGEGGINLKMPDKIVRDLADRGAEAAALFDDFDLAGHQRGRIETSLAALDGALAGLLDASTNPGVGDVVASLTPAARRDVSTAILELATRLSDGGHAADRDDVPSPHPDLRFVPRQ